MALNKLTSQLDNYLRLMRRVWIALRSLTGSLLCADLQLRRLHGRILLRLLTLLLRGHRGLPLRALLRHVQVRLIHELLGYRWHQAHSIIIIAKQRKACIQPKYSDSDSINQSSWNRINL